jgi:hypothetical protein
MSLFQRALAKIKGKRENPFPHSKHIIKHAFDVGGVPYFEFDTMANLPWKRAMQVMSIYEEMNSKCDKFYLQKHTEAIDAILTKKRIALPEMAQLSALNEQMKERLNWVISEDLIYKLAAVVFFDANENPDAYEWQYAAKKIEYWKKTEGVQDFFLHEPIQRLNPFLSDSATNFPLYSEAQMKLDLAQLENIYTKLLDKPKEDLPNFTQRYYSKEMSRESMN